jgi:hypothetical protein
MIFCNNSAGSGYTRMIKTVPEEDYLKDVESSEIILLTILFSIESPHPRTQSQPL